MQRFPCIDSLNHIVEFLYERVKQIEAGQVPDGGKST